MFTPDEFWMGQALQEARKAADADEVPVGAVVVCQDQLLAKAHNQVEQLKDPTAHAEMIALTQAANSLQSKWLHDATLYVTLEPCSMCAGALVLARVNRIVFGAYDSKTGACGSVFNIVQSKDLNHRIDVVGGICEAESSELLKSFFEAKRAK